MPFGWGLAGESLAAAGAAMAGEAAAGGALAGGLGLTAGAGLDAAAGGALEGLDALPAMQASLNEGLAASNSLIPFAPGGNPSPSMFSSVGNWIQQNPLLASMVGGQALQGITGAIGAANASNSQANAAGQARDFATSAFGISRNDLLPYIVSGYGGLSNLASMGPPIDPTRLNALTAPFAPTMEQLRQTPGYQFTLEQGLRGVQNSQTAKGYGTSANALTAAANYAEGLASTTYQQQFQNYQDQNRQIAAILAGAQGQNFTQQLQRSQLGALSGAQFGNIGAQLQNPISNALINEGNAQAQGTLGVANSIGNIGTGITNSLLLNNAANNGMGGIFNFNGYNYSQQQLQQALGAYYTNLGNSNRLDWPTQGSAGAP